MAEHNYAYDLPEGGQGANWFDDPAAVAARKAFQYPAGYFSIKDKVGVLLANSQTAPIVGQLLSKAMGGGPMSSMAPKNVDTSDNTMTEFMNMMRLSDLLKMAGSAIPLDAKIALNEALTKIKKD